VRFVAGEQMVSLAEASVARGRIRVEPETELRSDLDLLLHPAESLLGGTIRFSGGWIEGEIVGADQPWAGVPYMAPTIEDARGRDVYAE